MCAPFDRSIRPRLGTELSSKFGLNLTSPGAATLTTSTRPLATRIVGVVEVGPAPVILSPVAGSPSGGGGSIANGVSPPTTDRPLPAGGALPFGSRRVTPLTEIAAGVAVKNPKASGGADTNRGRPS